MKRIAVTCVGIAVFLSPYRLSPPPVPRILITAFHGSTPALRMEMALT